MPTHVRFLFTFFLLFLFLTAAGISMWPEFVIFCAIASFLFLAIGVFEHLKWKRDSRYSLDNLRALHEAGGPPPLVEDEVADDAGVVCPHCGNIYGAWLLI